MTSNVLPALYRRYRGVFRSYRSRGVRWSVVLAILAALVMSQVGCHRSTEGAQPDDSISIGVTATAAEPVPSLTTDDMRTEITALANRSTAPGHAMVRIVGTDGAAAQRDVTPLRAGNEVEHSADIRQRKIAQALSDIDAQLGQTVAQAPGLDPLRVLDRLSTLPGSRIYLLTSGVSTENPIDIRQLGWSFTPDQVVAAVARQGLLPHLNGRHVTLVGLGMTAGSQPFLPPAARDLVIQLWLRLCEKSGATCDVSTLDNETTQPRARQPVPLVPVPASFTDTSGCPIWDRLNDDVLFQADSAVLDQPTADKALMPIIEAAGRCRRVLDVAGYIADTGGGGDLGNLSGQRAQVVADRLLALGLPANQLGSVVGRGAADPVMNDIVNGQFDEDRAKLNRRVEISYRPL